MTGPGQNAPIEPRPGDGRRLPPVRGGVIPAILSVVGLVLIVVVSLTILAEFPVFHSSAAPPQSLAPGATEAPVTINPGRTVNPSFVVAPPSDLRPTVAGTILFARLDQNIWAASGTNLTQVSNKGTDSSPVWSPDGQSIYFLQAGTKIAQPPWGGTAGNAAHYTFYYDNVESMKADGTGRTQVYNSIFRAGGGWWMTTIAQPALSPDGKTLAVVSDAGFVPRSNNDIQAYAPVELTTLPAAGGKLKTLGVRQVNNLGHNNPAWSPDGTQLAFTFNISSGANGVPKIGIYTIATRKLRLLPAMGYADPSWSPDGRYIAAEQTTGTGRDIVIMNAANGDILVQLTNDGNSFAPVFSPNGDQIAFLHRQGLGTDLWIASLDLSGGRFTLVKTQPITEDGSLEPTSKPAWYIPADQRVAMPTPTPAPPPNPVPSSLPTSAPSTAP